MGKRSRFYNISGLTEMEFATILAGLRVYQAAGCPDMEHFAGEDPPTEAAIDDLCVRLNTTMVKLS